MSKTDDKVIIDVSDSPLLADLEVPALMREFNTFRKNEKLAEEEAAKWKLKKDSIGANIRVAIDAVKADAVTYTGQKVWRATLVRREPQRTLDEGKLMDNLLKLGKLDAATAAQIIEVSKTTGKAPEPYILLTVAEKGKGA